MLHANIPVEDPTKVRAYRARWIVPITRPPIDDGVVALQGGKIVFVGERRAWHEIVTDLGEVAILPGLVNAHTHLEFSDLAMPFGQRGDSFANWIPQVVAHRRARAERTQEQNLRLGLCESLAHGCSLLGEIATTDTWPQTEALAALSGVIFQEFLGWDRQQIPELLNKARAFVTQSSQQQWPRGLSPHAPYTVHRELLSGLCDLAVQHDTPLAMHLAESPAEMEFLATGQGPLRTMLEAAGVWQSDFWTEPLAPKQILDQLARAKRSLVIHGNQLQPADWDQLAAHRESMSVIYCPRTQNFFFPEQEYPLAQMLQRGVSVAIGTDSRASNPDLSLWRELQLIAEWHPISPAEVLSLGTEAGARALGFADTHGRLQVGYSDTLCVVRDARLCTGKHELAAQLLAPQTFATGL